MTDEGRPPFHTISAATVYRKIEDLETTVTKAITRMESQQEKTGENTDRIKRLEIQVYGIAAGLIAAVVALVGGLLG